MRTPSRSSHTPLSSGSWACRSVSSAPLREHLTLSSASWGVLALHRPARHPRFYRQLKRQNRELRGWLSWLGDLSPEALEHASDEMCGVLNGLWKRPTLTRGSREPVLSDCDSRTCSSRLARHTDVRDKKVVARMESTGFPPGDLFDV
jgi:hypothetical protein